MIAETQRARALEPELSSTREALPPRFLHEVFENTVRRLPGQAAVEVPAAGDLPRRRLTYAEIDELANDLAARAGAVRQARERGGHPPAAPGPPGLRGPAGGAEGRRRLHLRRAGVSRGAGAV